MRLHALFALTCAFAAVAAESSYTENFERAEVGKLPVGFTTYAGAFKVNEEAGKKFLELPGAPLDTFGVLFGPAMQPAGTDNQTMTATVKVYATSVKRKSPAFGISLGGVGGYRVQVSAAKGTLEIFKGDEFRANAPFQWKSGSWSSVKIQVRQTNGKWIVEGKAWTAETAEPADWIVTYEASEPPPPGKAAVWGNPFSGTAIRYDDLMVESGVNSPK